MTFSPSLHHAQKLELSGPLNISFFFFFFEHFFIWIFLTPYTNNLIFLFYFKTRLYITSVSCCIVALYDFLLNYQGLLMCHLLIVKLNIGCYQLWYLYNFHYFYFLLAIFSHIIKSIRRYLITLSTASSELNMFDKNACFGHTGQIIALKSQINFK